VLLLMVAVLLGVAGCGGKDRQNLTVFAAASLTETFGSLGKTFEASHPGVTVTFNFGGSATLARRIAQGAPADVFAAASPETMDQSKVPRPTPRVFARNRLEIAVPKGNPDHVTALKDLAGPSMKVALCAPQMPCGAAARTALAAAGVTVTPVSQEQDVKAALTKVRLGEADAALVYRTDVKAAAGAVDGVDFPEAAKAVNNYLIAAFSGTAHFVLAREFIDLVLSDEGRRVLSAAGFTPV
jgi:molybdate transport system substrate-binding protein